MQKNHEKQEINLDERRITWRNLQKILRICGYEQQLFAKLIELTPSGLSTNIWQHGNKPVSLNRIDILRELVGERNYELALAEIRRDEEEEAHRKLKR
jgi:predicted transcriptional regulator